MLTLETDRLLLVALSELHEEDIHALHCDPLILRTLFGGALPSHEHTRAKTLKYANDWRRYGFGFFGVYLKPLAGPDATLVGRSGLRHLENAPEIEFGHCFRESVCGQGMAQEAGRAVIEFAIENLALDRLVAVARPENLRGLRALQKMDWRYVDRRQHYGRLMSYFELTAQDYLLKLKPVWTSRREHNAAPPSAAEAPAR